MNHTPYRAVTKGFENPAQVVNSKRETIAVIYSDVEGGDQYENARLFAAAPDLLAAVHGLLASCGPQHESESAEMYQERMTLLQWHIDRASEALTKATGE